MSRLIATAAVACTVAMAAQAQEPAVKLLNSTKGGVVQAVTYPYQSRGVFRDRRDFLTGTYQLDQAQSDNPRRVADQTLRGLSPSERTRIENRLDPPEEISIEVINDTVTLASSRAPRMTFDANGRARAERGVGGRNMTTRATLYGDRLEVATSGDAETQFSATFEPLDNGRSLRVTKRLDVGRLRQPVVVQSTYRRTSEIPEWDVYNRDAESYNRDTESGRWSQYDEESVVADGTTLVATLDQDLDGRSVRQNERVTLTVRNAPMASLDGAILEGYLTTAPSSFGGQETVSIGFDRIRFRNGRTSSFAGTVESIRGPDGRPISFNGEEIANDSNSRDQAIQRGAIGAALGALIGAVVGGGKGAAIGAVVGGGGGAATVLLDDQRDLNLRRGTEFTIRARR